MRILCLESSRRSERLISRYSLGIRAREDALISFTSGNIFGISRAVVIFCKYFACKR